MNQKNQTFNNIDFNSFPKKLEKVLKDAVEIFWEEEINSNLLALNDFKELRKEKLIENTDFFSSQIKVERHKPFIVRLGKNFIDIFLSQSLEKSNKIFKLSDLTPLEVKILNSFAEFIYKKINEILIPTNIAKLSEKSEKYYNFLFLIKLKNFKSSKLMISIPIDRIELKEIKKENSFKDEDFITSKTQVKIRAGKTKITLDELKNLTNEDIILLEDSNYEKLTLISGNFEKDFNVKVNKSMIMNINNEIDFDENNNEVTMEKNLWDDIQIEISAEFEKVKMTIGELKQITQGQIVDLGSVFNNEISLFVENKKVAKGELIIINDRYAIKLNEVLNSKSPTIQAKPAQEIKKEATIQPKQPLQTPPKPTSKPQVKIQTNEDEEFDYSDFEK